MIKQQLVDRIERKYNPENDVPEGVQVTWVDMYLLKIIKAQSEKIEKLEKEIVKLKAWP